MLCPEPQGQCGQAWLACVPQPYRRRPQPPTPRVRTLVSRPGSCSVTEIAFLLMKQKTWRSIISKLLLKTPFFPGSSAVGPERDALLLV